ncbi:hypothetical protein CHUAL_013308 [Chamberlinius hualienensis]
MSHTKLLDSDMFYVNFNHEISTKNLINTISNPSNTQSIYFFSRIKSFDKFRKIVYKNLKYIENHLDLLSNLESDLSFCDELGNELEFCDTKDEKLLQLKFRRLCQHYESRAAYWLEYTNDKFYLRQIYNKQLHFERKMECDKNFLFTFKQRLLDIKISDVFLIQTVRTADEFLQDHNFDNHEITQFQKKMDKKLILFAKSNVEADYEFNKMVSKNEAVHLFKHHKQLEWCKSNCSMKINKQNNWNQCCTPFNILHFIDTAYRQFFILADDFGSGKSSIFNRIANYMIKNKKPATVTTIDLAKQQYFMKHLAYLFQSECLHQLVNFFTLTIGEKYHVEINELYVTTKNDVYVLFDNFDKIDKSCRSIFATWMKCIKKYSKFTVFISTNLEYKNELEIILDVPAIQFQKFNGAQCIQFLTQFWDVCLHFYAYSSDDEMSMNLTNYFDDCLNLYINTENCFKYELDYIRKPLILRLIAEECTKYLAKIINSGKSEFKMDSYQTSFITSKVYKQIKRLSRS